MAGARETKPACLQSPQRGGHTKQFNETRDAHLQSPQRGGHLISITKRGEQTLQSPQRGEPDWEPLALDAEIEGFFLESPRRGGCEPPIENLAIAFLLSPQRRTRFRYTGCCLASSTLATRGRRNQRIEGLT